MCRFARTAFLAYVDSKPHLLRRLHELSRQDIADYLGLTIETVSRTFTQLEGKAAIELPSSRRVCLCNRAALQRLNA
jgi:CRP-like cAMP-binding protein